MEAEQTTIRAVVRALNGDSALVEVEQGGCGRCHEKGGCGGQHLTQMLCSAPKTYQVDNMAGAVVGEQVIIAIAQGNLRKTANLAYVTPLIACIAGAAFGAPLGGDAGAILGAVSGLILAFTYIRLQVRRNAGNPADRPHIISRS